MSIESIAIKPPATPAFVTADSEDLVRIREPAVNLAVWQRHVPRAMQQYIERTLLPMSIQRATMAGADVNLDALLAGLPAEDGLADLRADIECLCGLYRRLTAAPRLSIKLQCLGETLCERFHVDWVRLRLICSYAGPGTQWLAPDDVDRRWLSPDCGPLPDERSGLLRPGATVHTLDRFAVGLMKGEAWPGNRGRGLVHRSPRTGDATVRRVLLKIEGVD